MTRHAFIFIRGARAGLRLAWVLGLALRLGGVLAAEPAPTEWPLYEGAAPGAPAQPPAELWETYQGQRLVRNVSRPTLSLVAPAPGQANGASVIIAPGGALLLLSIDHEGFAVARALAAQGFTAWVLKYRLDETPAEPAAFGAVMGARMKGLVGGAPRPQSPAVAWSREDALTAVALVRGRAASLGLDARRVGLLGFSGGGSVVMAAAQGYRRTAERPDFVASIYGLMDFNVPAPADAPPLFIAHALDDPLRADTGIAMFRAWRAGGHAAELHVFQSGGHGFGLRQQGRSSDPWLGNLVAWLQALPR